MKVREEVGARSGDESRPMTTCKQELEAADHPEFEP